VLLSTCCWWACCSAGRCCACSHRRRCAWSSCGGQGSGVWRRSDVWSPADRRTASGGWRTPTTRRHEDAPVSVSGPPGRRVVFHRSSRLAEHRLIRRIPPTPSRVPVDPVGDHPASRVAGLTVRSDPAVGDRCAVSEHGARCHLGAERPSPSRASAVPHRRERGDPRGTAVVCRRAGRVTTRRWPRRSSRSPDRPRGRSSRWRHPLRRVSPPPRRYSAGAGTRSASRPSARWLAPRGVRPLLGRHVPASTSAGLSPPPAPRRSCTELLGVRSGIRSPFPTGEGDRRPPPSAVSSPVREVTGCPPVIPKLSPDPA
jgi:hypothetical protein